MSSNLFLSDFHKLYQSLNGLIQVIHNPIVTVSEEGSEHYIYVYWDLAGVEKEFREPILELVRMIVKKVFPGNLKDVRFEGEGIIAVLRKI